MLRITRITGDGNLPSILKLEGSLREPWVSELRSQVDQSQDQPCLDLQSVQFIDADGINLLHDLQSRGCRIIACSNFVAAMLKLETRP